MIDAVDVLPAPPSVEVICTLLFFTPAAVPTTFADSVQALLAANVAADKLMEVAPATAVTVPPQELVRPFGVETASPAGKLSVNATPVRGIVLAAGLVMVKLSEVVPLSGILDVPKDLAIVGAVATDTVAVAVLPLPPLIEVTLLVVLTKLPEEVPVTFAINVQVAPTPTVPLVSEMLADPATAVALPPQVLVKPLGVDTTIPAGSESVNATPASATAFAAGLVIVKVSDVEPFSGIDVAPNALAIEGGATTFNIAVLLVVPVPPSDDVTLPVVLF